MTSGETRVKVKTNLNGRFPKEEEEEYETKLPPHMNPKSLPGVSKTYAVFLKPRVSPGISKTYVMRYRNKSSKSHGSGAVLQGLQDIDFGIL